MTSFDWIVIALYGVGMLAIGGYYSRRTKSAEDYLLGGRNMNSLVVGLSLFATLISTLSYLALPGEMIQHGPMFFCQMAAYPFVAVVVGWLLIPFIMRLKITSAYEILELRLGLSVRLVGSCMFLLLRLAWMAAILYATASTVLVPLLGLSSSYTPWICVAMGVLTVIYTAAGGLRAVVVTDALQCAIMFVGAVVTLAVISVELGGVDAWWPTQWASHWDKASLGFDATARTSVLGAAISAFTWYVCTTGSDQMAIQRFLATRDVSAARRSLFTSLVTDALIMGLLGLVGLAVLAFFTANRSLLDGTAPLVDEADQLFPTFVVVGLPAGVSGLVIAAILSAAMSSLSSGVNSACAVITEDFIGRLCARKGDWSNLPGRSGGCSAENGPVPFLCGLHGVWLVRGVSAFVGTVAVALSILVGSVEGNLIELCFKVVNLLTAPLFVLFFTAMFVRWATPSGALTGLGTSLAVAIGIAYFDLFGLSFLWMMPASLLSGIAVAALASAVGKVRSQETAS